MSKIRMKKKSTRLKLETLKMKKEKEEKGAYMLVLLNFQRGIVTSMCLIRH